MGEGATFGDWVSAEFMVTAGAVFFVAFMLTLLVDYWRGEGGLRKGSVLLGALAVVLMLSPSAKNLVFKFAGAEVAYSSQALEISANVQQEQVQILAQNDVLAIQLRQVSDTLDELQRQNEAQKEQILKTLQDISMLDVASEEKAGEIRRLVEARVAEAQSAPVILRIYRVAAQELVFNKICEKANDTGEFYYSFLVNGQPLVERRLADRVEKRQGEEINFRGKDHHVDVQSRGEGGIFIFRGSINEYDGKTFFRGSRKITLVGEVNEQLPLEVGVRDIEFTTEHGRDICRATLTIEVKQLSGAAPAA